MASRSEILRLLTQEVYGSPILNNAHRGDVVEMMVAHALGPSWRFCGLGWHPWDFESSIDGSRIRIQVKQSAREQLWGVSKRVTLQFGWKEKAPSYFSQNNPGVPIEDKGRFCEILIIGVHEETGVGADQLDSQQWRFFVIPEREIAPKIKSMALHVARKRWTPVALSELAHQTEKTASLIIAEPVKN